MQHSWTFTGIIQSIWIDDEETIEMFELRKLRERKKLDGIWKESHL